MEVVTARVFRSGNRAVRLPKQFRLKSKEVEIFRRGDQIILREKNGTMVRAFDLLAGLPDDVAHPLDANLHCVPDPHMEGVFTRNPGAGVNERYRDVSTTIRFNGAD